MTVSISKERLGGRHVTGGFCARLQKEISLLSPAKDGQKWWVTTGSQKKAIPLVLGMGFAHALISALVLRAHGSSSWVLPVCGAFLGQPGKQTQTTGTAFLFAP